MSHRTPPPGWGGKKFRRGPFLGAQTAPRRRLKAAAAERPEPAGVKARGAGEGGSEGRGAEPLSRRRLRQGQEQLASEIRIEMIYFIIKASTIVRKRRLAVLSSSIFTPLPDRLRGD